PANSPSTTTIDTTSGDAGMKSGRTVTLTAEDMQKKKKNDVKARTTLLLSLPDEHQLRFSKYKIARELWAAILKTFGGNEATKKTKKNLLKQQYGNFKAEGSETLEQTFTRLQVIIGQLQFMDVEIEQDNLNQKFLTSLAPEWLIHAIKKSEPNSQNMAFISSAKYSSGNEDRNTACVPTASTNVPTASASVATISQDTACAYIASQSSADEVAPIEFALMANTNAESKDLDNLIESQRSEKIKDGFGYSAVPPPPAQLYLSLKKDLSWTSLPECADDTVTDYSRPSLTVESKTESPKKPPVKYAEQYRKPNKKPNVRGNKRNWNNLKTHQLGPDFVMKKKACFNCGDFNHLTYDCRKRVRKSFTPKLVTHRPYRPSQRPVRTNMNGARQNKTFFNKQAHSYANRPFHRTSAVRPPYRAPWVPTVNRNFPPVNRKFSPGSQNFPTANRKFPTASRKFPTGSTKCSTADIGIKGKAVKPSACWFWKPLQNLSNKGNISYLSDYEPFDGGYVSFGQGGCKITGKGTIKTGKLEFEKIYFVKDHKYNLFSVSQICDNKNSVLFTNSECIVLGRDFNLLDDANILPRTPRHHKMYSIDLNNIVPHKDLTCLVAEASADECMLWHRRLGHLNFKTMNKLVRHNLVRGLPTKCFENDHTCTACLKGKQHKAFKGIKREFSNVRTPQQNGVAKRRNRTLIEAARTMLANAKLPVTFWAEAVNTACYVQNRVLVNKSHNKTPYELFNGRSPAIGFLKPFGYHVMIFNTLDNLGKIEEKRDEGYFIGYSMSSKAFRVFNKRTKRVEENLDVEFLENKAIEKGAGPNWLFDIDSLTKSMNYVPVDASTISTNLLVEPKKISDALQDPSWVEAIQEELLQFKIQNV
nr:ribonuclease H-like domain-containing protein [Tanacetum cinerariifolium]